MKLSQMYQFNSKLVVLYMWVWHSMFLCVLRRPGSVLTRDVLDTVCSCLLAQAEESERTAQTPAMAQHMILQEFGCCLSEITKALLK